MVGRPEATRRRHGVVPAQPTGASSRAGPSTGVTDDPCSARGRPQHAGVARPWRTEAAGLRLAHAYLPLTRSNRPNSSGMRQSSRTTDKSSYISFQHEPRTRASAAWRVVVAVDRPIMFAGRRAVHRWPSAGGQLVEPPETGGSTYRWSTGLARSCGASLRTLARSAAANPGRERGQVSVEAGDVHDAAGTTGPPSVTVLVPKCAVKSVCRFATLPVVNSRSAGLVLRCRANWPNCGHSLGPAAAAAAAGAAMATKRSAANPAHVLILDLDSMVPPWLQRPPSGKSLAARDRRPWVRPALRTMYRTRGNPLGVTAATSRQLLPLSAAVTPSALADERLPQLSPESTAPCIRVRHCSARARRGRGPARPWPRG